MGARQRYDYYFDNGGNPDHDYYPTSLPAALSPYIFKQARGDSWQNVDADVTAPGPLSDAFLCPSDEQTALRSYGQTTWLRNAAENITAEDTPATGLTLKSSAGATLGSRA